MKKYILLLIIIGTTTSSLWCNVQIPRARISEIFIDSIGNWTIELGFWADNNTVVDSIRIETSSGSSKVEYYTLVPGVGWPNFDSLTVINNSNLVQPITINPVSDYVKVISYSWGYESIDSIAFGNYPGSMLDCANQNESIGYLIYKQNGSLTASFCIDKTPTIGYSNDTTGALSTFSGYVYDLNGDPFTEGWFPLPFQHNTTIHINPDGSFSERIFSRRHTFDTIRIYFPDLRYYEDYTIEPVDFCLRPDSIHNQNIITTSLVADIPEQNDSLENIVVVSPNPFTKKITFLFRIRHFLPTDEILLIIHAQNGTILKQKELFINQKSYEWIPDNSIPKGTLIYQVIRNNQTIKTGKLIRL